MAWVLLDFVKSPLSFRSWTNHFLSWNGPLTLLAFPPMTLWLPVRHTDLWLCWSHCSMYLLEPHSPNISGQTVNNCNKDARVWNLKQVLERKAGVPGVMCCIASLPPFTVSSRPVNYLSKFHCLSKELLLLSILVSSLFLTVTEWLIRILVISCVSISILLCLKGVLSHIN